MTFNYKKYISWIIVLWFWIIIWKGEHGFDINQLIMVIIALLIIVTAALLSWDNESQNGDKK